MIARSRLVGVVTLLALLCACRGGDGAQRSRVVDESAARRLAGTWTVSFAADSLATPALSAAGAVVAGTLILTAEQHGAPDVDELRGITDDGVYDLDFRPFGFTSGTPAVLVARVVAGAGEVGKGASADSVYLVLSPGTPRFAVRMAGIVAADGAAGVWSASAFSMGGGAGTFVMRRRQAVR